MTAVSIISSRRNRRHQNNDKRITRNDCHDRPATRPIVSESIRQFALARFEAFAFARGIAGRPSRSAFARHVPISHLRQTSRVPHGDGFPPAFPFADRALPISWPVLFEFSTSLAPQPARKSLAIPQVEADGRFGMS